MRKVFVLILAMSMLTVAVAPSVLATSIIDTGEWLEIDPVGSYDELQVMSEDMNSTYEDWYYKPVGRYIGPTTPESEAWMKRITQNDDLVTVTQEMTFSAEDIMSGVGDFWARTPVRNEGWSRAWVMLFSLESDTAYFINTMGELGFDSDDAVLLNRLYIDPDDETIYDGNDYFSKNSRTYVRMVAPLKPETRYLFVQACEYDLEERIGLFVSSTVIPDGRSAINVYQTSTNENVETRLSTLSLGWSFIMTEGFSDGVKGHRVELEDGVSLEIYLEIEGAELPERQDNVSILIPFLSNYELDWELDLYHNTLPSKHYYTWANDTKNYISVRTSEFTNRDPLSDYWTFMLTIESVSPPDGAEAVFFLFDEATLAPYYGSLLGDDLIDDFLSYYPDNVSMPLSSLRIYHGSSLESRNLGFSLVHYVDMVDQNGTFLESIAGSQITKGIPGKQVNGLLDYNIIGEGAGAWYDSKVYRGIEGYLKYKSDAGEWVEENIPGVSNNPYKAEGEVAWVMEEYRTNEAFQEAANIVLSHPVESTVVYLVNGTDGLLWLSGEYANGEDPDWSDIYDEFSDEEGPLDWLADFIEWVKTSWVTFRMWMENLVDALGYWLEMTVSVANLCCVSAIGLPAILFMIAIYFVGDFFIHLAISPKNTLHRVFNKAGDFVRSFIIGRDGP